jgi:hypothetical protein
MKVSRSLLTPVDVEFDAGEVGVAAPELRYPLHHLIVRRIQPEVIEALELGHVQGVKEGARVVERAVDVAQLVEQHGQDAHGRVALPLAWTKAVKLEMVETRRGEIRCQRYPRGPRGDDLVRWRTGPAEGDGTAYCTPTGQRTLTKVCHVRSDLDVIDASPALVGEAGEQRVEPGMQVAQAIVSLVIARRATNWTLTSSGDGDDLAPRRPNPGDSCAEPPPDRSAIERHFDAWCVV